MLIFLFLSKNLYSQNTKEIVYLLFDMNSEEKCMDEDNDGNTHWIKKYKKEISNNNIYFFICKNKFIYNKKKHKADTCARSSLNKLMIRDVSYLFEKDSRGYFIRFRVENEPKKFIVEKISNNRIIIYEVYLPSVWIETCP